MLYDPYGRILESPPAKPIGELIGAVRVRDQFSNYPTTKLTPEKLAGIFKEADQGVIERQAELGEEMEEKDPILGSVLQTRKLAVQGLEYEILPFSEASEDKKIADAVRENFDDFDLEDAILDLMDSLFKAFATVEINWQMDGNKAWAVDFEWIHQKRYTFHELTAAYNAKLPKLPRLLTDEEPITGIEIPPFKIIYHRYKARSGFTQRGGLLRPLSWYYLFKNYDIKDWVVFLEKFGQPVRIGKFTAGASDDDKKILKEALQYLGTDAAALISDQTTLDILEAKTGAVSGDLYERFALLVDKYYALAVLGQTATTEGTPGKLGAEEARDEVRHDLLKSDARALSKSLRSQLIWPMVGFNFGWDKPIPKIRFEVEDPEDLESTSRTHKTLVEIGVPIPLSYAQKKYGIPAPKEGEEVLTAPAPAANPFQPNNPSSSLRVTGTRAPIKKKVMVGSRLIDLEE